MTKRQSSRTDRNRLMSLLRYQGDARHKLHPGDYGFLPPVSPRPSKWVCDDLRPMLRERATALFRGGVAAGMVSAVAPGSTPKYVWAVDEAGAIYEAKTKPPDTLYHGYRLGEDERDMRRYIRDEWRIRCDPR